MHILCCVLVSREVASEDSSSFRRLGTGPANAEWRRGVLGGVGFDTQRPSSPWEMVRFKTLPEIGRCVIELSIERVEPVVFAVSGRLEAAPPSFTIVTICDEGRVPGREN